MAPQFALFSEVGGWLTSYDYEQRGNSTVISKFVKALKRIVIPATILLVGIGLVAIVTSPVMAYGKSASGGAAPVSGYWEQTGAEPRAAGAQEDVPVIMARSDPLAAPVQEAAASNGDYDLVAPPSLSVGQIERVLAQYGSPAAGQGKLLYDLGVRYGIDPAYALAFFVHESGCGTKGVARFSKSLGNIRWTPGYEEYSGYRKYASWEAGMEDWYKLITELYIGDWNLRTVDKIIPVYAPWGDNNNPPAYIRSVKMMVDSWRGK
jgi:hypothetical protein